MSREADRLKKGSNVSPLAEVNRFLHSDSFPQFLLSCLFDQHDVGGSPPSAPSSSATSNDISRFLFLTLKRHIVFKNAVTRLPAIM